MLKKEEIYQIALQAGFMLSTEYGQEQDKLMPCTDGNTLVQFVKLIENKINEKNDD